MASVLKRFQNRIGPTGQQKPQGPLRIDWSHPLTRGLKVYCIDSGGGWLELVTGIKGVSRDGSGTAAPYPSSGVSLGGPAVLWSNNGSVQFSVEQALGTATIPLGTVATACVIPSADPNGRPVLSYYDGPTQTNGYVDYEIANTSITSYVSGFTSGVTFTQTLNAYQSFASSLATSTSSNVYLNGKLSGSDTLTASTLFVPGNSATLTIADYNSAGSPMTGFVYYAAIWNRTLTAAEVNQLHWDPYCFLLPVETEWNALLLLGGSVAKTLTATCTTTATLVSRGYAKILAATCTSTAALIRGVAKKLTATCTSTSTALKLLPKSLLATCTSTASLLKPASFPRALAATCTSTASVLKSVGKPLVATCTSTATLIRSVGKKLAATCTSTATLVRSTGKLLLATCTTTASIIRSKPVLLIATCTSAASLIRSFGKPLATTCTSTASLLKRVGKPLIATCTSTASVLKSLPKTLVATCTTTASMLKAFPRLLVAICTTSLVGSAIKNTFTTYSQNLVATCTTSVTLIRSLSSHLVATCTTSVSLIRTVAKKLTATCTTTLTGLAHKCITYTQSLVAICTTSSIIATAKAGVVYLAQSLRYYKPQPTPVIPGSEVKYLQDELLKVSNAFKAHVDATKSLDARLRAGGL